MDETRQEIQRRALQIAANIEDTFSKGGGYPEGTIKVWSGERFQKVNGQWKYLGKVGKGESQEVKKEEKKSKEFKAGDEVIMPSIKDTWTGRVVEVRGEEVDVKYGSQVKTYKKNQLTHVKNDSEERRKEMITNPPWDIKQMHPDTKTEIKDYLEEVVGETIDAEKEAKIREILSIKADDPNLKIAYEGNMYSPVPVKYLTVRYGKDSFTGTNLIASATYYP